MIHQTAALSAQSPAELPKPLEIFVGDTGAQKLSQLGDHAAPAKTASRGKRMTFQSKEMNALVQLATRFAESSAAVMIVGESGTGKEMFSRLIHDKSKQASEAFVAVNCAAIPEDLLESEMFGHERGAFTGAIQRRVGYFERADKSTLLLDEISEIPLAMQAKMLRVIEEQEIQAVGSDQPRAVNVRIVATTNRDLQTEVAAGRFREDLYHRLNVLEINVPPLRERKPDIPPLVLHFVQMFRHETKSVVVQHVTKTAMRHLCQYHWPGNVRQLRNVIHRACVVCDAAEIDVDSLPVWRSPPKKLNNGSDLTGLPLAEVERYLILESLKKFGGNKKLAAAELGVTSRTLANKLKQYAESTTLSLESAVGEFVEPAIWQ